MRWPLIIAATMALAAVACGDDDNVEEGEPTVPVTTPRPTPAPTVDLTLPIESDAVWSPDASIVELQACAPEDLDCVSGVMENAEASEEAVDFFAATGWFLTEVREMEAVDLAAVSNPWRANSNTDWALLNGTPPIVFAEEAANHLVPDESAPAYGALISNYPELLIWQADATYEMSEPSPDGGRSFIFQYPLNDGCHACATGYAQRVALDVAADGTFRGPRLLDVCQLSEAQPIDPAPPVEGCPAIA